MSRDRYSNKMMALLAMILGSNTLGGSSFPSRSQFKYNGYNGDDTECTCKQCGEKFWPESHNKTSYCPANETTGKNCYKAHLEGVPPTHTVVRPEDKSQSQHRHTRMYSQVSEGSVRMPKGMQITTIDNKENLEIPVGIKNKSRRFWTHWALKEGMYINGEAPKKASPPEDHFNPTLMDNNGKPYMVIPEDLSVSDKDHWNNWCKENNVEIRVGAPLMEFKSTG